jgi:hypothetical protein
MCVLAWRISQLQQYLMTTSLANAGSRFYGKKKHRSKAIFAQPGHVTGSLMRPVNSSLAGESVSGNSQMKLRF